MKKIQFNTRHRFPFSPEQPQFLTVPNDWEEWVYAYSHIEVMAKTANSPMVKDHTKTAIFQNITNLEDSYGTNPTMMGIAKLRKKFYRLLTSMPKTIHQTHA